jgi:ribosomal protein S18 acetylase RimI-like enzyme
MVSAENDPRRAGTIWVFDLNQSVRAVKPLSEASFSLVRKESIPELAVAMGADTSAEIKKRFEAGRRCYVAMVESKIAAYGWVSFDEEFIGELNLLLKLFPGEAYIWNCATLPAFQGVHLYSALLTYILEDLSREKFHRVWIGADLENVASQRGIARAGFRYIADLVVARVLALRQVWAQGRPEVPESLVAEARRVFLNDRDRVWLDARSSAASE